MQNETKKKKFKILAITLARGGSKSVPRKNIKKLSGYPLIYYTIKEAKKSKYISRYLVSTDDKDIQKISIGYGAEAPFIRPSKYSNDRASSVSALQHAVNWVERKEGIKYEYIIELMVTNPLKNSLDIDLCIEKLINTGADSVIAVHQLHDNHPARIKKIINDKIVDFCIPEKLESRRQDLTPKAYIRSGSIYALKRDHLMNEGLRYGSVESRPYILPQERAINIDSLMDFYFAEKLLAMQNKKNIS